MLIKDGGLANKYVSVDGTGTIGDPFVIKHSFDVTPDTAAGDLASIAADIAIVKADIAHMKADLAAILAILES